MIPAFRLEAAEAYLGKLATATYELAMPATFRNRAAAACYGIAQDHHHAIVLLIRAERFASALALLRLTFEAYIRGAWLDTCSTDEQSQKFLLGSEPPRISRMLAELEATERFSDGVLSSMKKQHWDAMCDFTHSGGLHAQRWNTAESVEPSYDREELEQALRYAEHLGGLAAIGTALLADRQDLPETIGTWLKELRAQPHEL
jgi:hypothetical protein